MYSPERGRFLQTDPIGYKDDLNWYAYVGNNPVNNIDPEGKYLTNIVSGVVNAAIGAGVSWVAGVRDPGRLVTNAVIDFGVGAVTPVAVGKIGQIAPMLAAKKLVRPQRQQRQSLRSVRYLASDQGGGHKSWMEWRSHECSDGSHYLLGRLAWCGAWAGAGPIRRQ